MGDAPAEARAPHAFVAVLRSRMMATISALNLAFSIADGHSYDEFCADNFAAGQW